VCLWLALPRGIVWLLRTWLVSALVLVLIWGLGGRSSKVTADAVVALVSGLGAMVLAVGLYDGKLVRRR